MAHAHHPPHPTRHRPPPTTDALAAAGPAPVNRCCALCDRTDHRRHVPGLHPPAHPGRPAAEPGMRVRRHGTADQIQRMTHLLATVCQISRVSRLYPDQPPCRLARCYLDLTPPAAPTTAPQPPDGSDGPA